MVFFSNILGRPVIDQTGKKLGTVKDLIFIDGEKYAEISHLILQTDEHRRKKIPFICVHELKDQTDKKRIDIDIHLNLPEEKLPVEVEKDREMLATRLLDRQLIDIDGLKIVRVNDLLLGKVENKFCIFAVDVGTTGLLRRLGFDIIRKMIFSGIQDHIIPWEYVEPFDGEIGSLRIKVQRSKIADMHPADIADIMEDLSLKDRALIFNSLDNQTAAQTLIEAQPDVQQSVFKNLKNKRISEILENMPADEAADILGVLPSFRSDEILNGMKSEAGEKVKKLLQYKSDVAGGLMSTDFIVIPMTYTAEETIKHLREISPSPNYTYYLYVCDENSKLRGVLSLRDLVISPAQRKISEFMITDVISVHVETTKEEIYKTINKYNLMVLPVVDSKNCLVGVISADDIIDLMIPKSLKRQRLLVNRTGRHKRRKPDKKNGNGNEKISEQKSQT